jgi:hypothetical protein
VAICSFVISQIEEGQRLYGVGTQRQMCLLIDRGGSVRRNGVPKVEVRDMAVLPRVAVLVNTIVNTVQVSKKLSPFYPALPWLCLDPRRHTRGCANSTQFSLCLRKLYVQDLN